MTNSVTVRTKQLKIIIAIVGTILVYVVNFEYLWILVVAAVLTELASKAPYDAHQESASTTRWKVLLRLPSVTVTTGEGAERSLFVLTTWRKFSSTLQARFIRIGLARHASRALSGAESIVRVALDEVIATVLALAKVGWRFLVQYPASMCSTPMTFAPHLVVGDRFAAATFAKF